MRCSTTTRAAASQLLTRAPVDLALALFRTCVGEWFHPPLPSRLHARTSADSHPLTLDGLFAYTLYLVFKEPDALDCASRHSRPQSRVPSDCRFRPFQGNLSRLLATIHSVKPSPVREERRDTLQGGGSAVRRTLQSYDGRQVLSNPSAKVPRQRICRDKKFAPVVLEQIVPSFLQGHQRCAWSGMRRRRMHARDGEVMVSP